MIEGFGLRVMGSGCRVWVYWLGFRVQDVGLGFIGWGLEFRMWGLGLLVGVQGFGFGVWGLGSEVKGLGSLVCTLRLMMLGRRFERRVCDRGFILGVGPWNIGSREFGLRFRVLFYHVQSGDPRFECLRYDR